MSDLKPIPTTKEGILKVSTAFLEWAIGWGIPFTIKLEPTDIEAKEESKEGEK